MTVVAGPGSLSLINFNPHLPHRRWPEPQRNSPPLASFQSTPSSQKVTVVTLSDNSIYVFQSTPSSQKVTGEPSCTVIHFYISIHTFLTEGDSAAGGLASIWDTFQSTPSSQKVTRAFKTSGSGMAHFNPHLPHRRWHRETFCSETTVAFQSTPSSQKVANENGGRHMEELFQSTPSSQKVTLAD